MRTQTFTEVHGCSNEEASQTIYPEVYSKWGQSPQGPDPPTLPYLLQAGIIAVYLIDYHNSHVSLGVIQILYKLKYRLEVEANGSTQFRILKKPFYRNRAQTVRILWWFQGFLRSVDSTGQDF